MAHHNLLEKIEEYITGWMADRANNAIEPGSAKPAFGVPLIGAACGEDPLFPFLKNDIGTDFYWTPEQAYGLAFPDQPVKPDELMVISWVLPQTKETRTAHRQAKNFPSIEWSKARHYGEMVNGKLRQSVVRFLKEQGVKSCAPMLLPQFKKSISDRYGFASSWSERHTAYVCGLGTFGLSDGLITSVGKAIRVGSVIGKMRFEPTTRSYQRHQQWCLHFNDKKCMVCARRCPADAISSEGHDKKKCKTYIRSVTAPHVEQEQLGVRVNSCGICQTKVPCESFNPTRRKRGSRTLGEVG
ncbi:MAG: 4Fe-4S ferredoxin [Desulfobulbaceae bacterium]|mgnify:FL=1|nr:MAG: 4Fe-4S ferredoxin [Desulfobulbaceae bacterium]